jgi:hypothetical protein
MDSQEQKMIDNLILSGALQVAGIDQETGDFLYQFTQKLEEVSPDLYHEHINYVNNELMKFWENGFLEINFMDDNPMVTLTEKAFSQSEIDKLSKEDKWGIEEIKRILKTQEL